MPGGVARFPCGAHAFAFGLKDKVSSSACEAVLELLDLACMSPLPAHTCTTARHTRTRMRTQTQTRAQAWPRSATLGWRAPSSRRTSAHSSPTPGAWRTWHPVRVAPEVAIWGLRAEAWLVNGRARRGAWGCFLPLAVGLRCGHCRRRHDRLHLLSQAPRCLPRPRPACVCRVCALLCAPSLLQCSRGIGMQPAQLQFPFPPGSPPRLWPRRVHAGRQAQRQVRRVQVCGRCSKCICVIADSGDAAATCTPGHGRSCQSCATTTTCAPRQRPRLACALHVHTA